jgi:hypothetical protein
MIVNVSCRIIYPRASNPSLLSLKQAIWQVIIGSSKLEGKLPLQMQDPQAL